VATGSAASTTATGATLPATGTNWLPLVLAGASLLALGSIQVAAAKRLRRVR
jgi:LPXTG-motif cell wall-anchored protein